MRPIHLSNTSSSNENLLSSTQLAARLGVAPVTLARWRAEGLPRIRLSNRAYRYNLSEVLAWLTSRQDEAQP